MVDSHRQMNVHVSPMSDEPTAARVWIDDTTHQNAAITALDAK